MHVPSCSYCSLWATFDSSAYLQPRLNNRWKCLYNRLQPNISMCPNKSFQSFAPLAFRASKLVTLLLVLLNGGSGMVVQSLRH